jgi:hypothetical protein
MEELKPIRQGSSLSCLRRVASRLTLTTKTVLLDGWRKCRIMSLLLRLWSTSLQLTLLLTSETSQLSHSRTQPVPQASVTSRSCSGLGNLSTPWMPSSRRASNVLASAEIACSTTPSTLQLVHHPRPAWPLYASMQAAQSA